MKTRIFKIPLLLLTIALFSVYVNAFAVSMPYMENALMIMYPGQSSDFELTLQNMVGDQDETAKVVITKGNEIARITDKENIYKVPKGTKNTKVHIRIDIPGDTPLGTEWDVRFSANIVTGITGDMVQIVTGLSDGFKVRIGPLPEQKPLTKEKSWINTWWLIGGVIAIVLIVSLILYSKRKKK